MTWRVAFRLRGDAEDSYLDSVAAADAHHLADELWREDAHQILERLAIEETVGGEWVERTSYDCA